MPSALPSLDARLELVRRDHRLRQRELRVPPAARTTPTIESLSIGLSFHNPGEHLMDAAVRASRSASRISETVPPRPLH